jgi:DNA ligase-1
MSASWIHKLNESDSRLDKEEVIRQAYSAAILGNKNSDYFLNMLKVCYDTYQTFGVKQIPDTEGITDAENPWDDFSILLHTLSTRALTGNAARDAIQAISLRFDSTEWNTFLAPVLRRDMRAGISEKTINKIVKRSKYEIPVFGCQLATNSEGRPEMQGKKRLEPKLDGVRVLLLVTPTARGMSATCFSRNGKVFENFAHIEQQILNSFHRFPSDLCRTGVVLDGEVVGNSFQELMRQARRKENVQNEDSVFHVFDILPLSNFVAGRWNTPLSKRIAILDSLRDIIHDMPNVELLPHVMIDLDTGEGRDIMHRYAEEMVTAGFEGIMIKDLDAGYECDRNKSWLKYKPVYDYDLTVVGMEEGTGKNKGRMGALVCEGVDDGKHIIVNVGSGYTDVERKDYWDNRADVIGKTAVVMADAITLNQNGTYSLRFPRFKEFRYDK